MKRNVELMESRADLLSGIKGCGVFFISDNTTNEIVILVHIF